MYRIGKPREKITAYKVCGTVYYLVWKKGKPPELYEKPPVKLKKAA